MEIEFISHASLRIESGGASIVTDPWLRSKAFNDGWALLSPAADVDWTKIDYLWISHEHPDHFNIPTLKAIPEEQRRRIVVLYQRHASPRMVDAFKRFGFNRIIELPLYRWTPIRPGLEVLCGSVGSLDSFLAVRDGEECVLNLNDCVLNKSQLKYIKRLVGSVSILFTQFSFAHWVGNEADEVEGAARKIRQLQTQARLMDPEFVVPFASFVYFCNEENQRMNAWANSPAKIAELPVTGLNFMYPGDVWTSDERTFQHQEAIARLEQDAANMTIDPTPQTVSIDKLEEAVTKCLVRNRERFSKSTLRRIDPFTIYVHDLDRLLTVYPSDLTYAVEETDEDTAKAARYVMSSQVAWYAFEHTWGFNTVEISGMYLDREFATKGRNPFIFYQNLLSTKVLDFKGIRQSIRTLLFFWRKKWELFYRFARKGTAV